MAYRIVLQLTGIGEDGMGWSSPASTDFPAASFSPDFSHHTAQAQWTVIEEFLGYFTCGFNKTETFPPFSLMSVCSFFFC